MSDAAEAWAARVIRPEIRALSAYAVAEAKGLVKLDAMENPYALPDTVRDRIAATVRDVAINRYPSGGAAGVKSALRRSYGIDDGLEIVLGNGSDELIQMIVCATARAGAVVMAPEPTFVMYRMYAAFAGVRYAGVDLAGDFSLDMPRWRAALDAERPAVVFIAYPNNPTGNAFAERDIEELVERAPGLVVVDEAYHAFARRTFLGHLRRYPNLLVLRTLSKAGMAGLRLGYAVGPAAWTGEIDKVRAPYNVNALTQAIVPELLRERGVLDAQAEALREQRARLIGQLGSLPGVRVFPSEANFVVIRVPDARAWFDALKADGILVKNLHGSHPLVAECLRITVGTPEENDLLLGSMRQLS